MNLLHQPWNIVFLVGFVAYLSIRNIFIKRTKGNEKVTRRVDSLEKVLMAVVFLGSLLVPVVYLLTPALAFADYHLPSVAPWFGSVIMLAALWLFWRSHNDLGLNWSMTLEVRKDHQLIRDGVYRRIRHPMYASIWLFGIAQALMLPNWIAGPSALVTFAPLCLLRIPREEKMMFDTFHEDYHYYKGRTGKMFPKFMS